MSVNLPHIKTTIVQRSKSESNVSISPAFETKNQHDSLLSPRAGIPIPTKLLPPVPVDWHISANQDEFIKLITRYGITIFGSHCVTFMKKSSKFYAINFDPILKSGTTNPDLELKKEKEIIAANLMFKEPKEPHEAHSTMISNLLSPIFFTLIPKRVISLRLVWQDIKENRVDKQEPPYATLSVHDLINKLFNLNPNNLKMKWLHLFFSRDWNKRTTEQNSFYELELQISELSPYWRNIIFASLSELGLFTENEATYFRDICPFDYTKEEIELSKCLQVFLQDFTNVLDKNPNNKEQIHNLFDKIIDIAKILQSKSLVKGMVIDHIDTSVGMGETAGITGAAGTLGTKDEPKEKPLFFLDSIIVLELVQYLKDISLKHAILTFDILSTNLVDINYYPQFLEAARLIATTAYNKMLELQESQKQYYGILENVLLADYWAIYRRFRSIVHRSEAFTFDSFTANLHQTFQSIDRSFQNGHEHEAAIEADNFKAPITFSNSPRMLAKPNESDIQQVQRQSPID